MDDLRVVISGGGTGGHIFPAISIAQAVKASRPETDILFVGAKGRMEMSRVPEAGFRIEGLNVQGFDRKNMLKNIKVAFNAFMSHMEAKKILREFRPHVAVGVGGYASGPTLSAASSLGIPILLQEQNSFAGVTNRMMRNKAQRICVAYDRMNRYFPEDKIMLTGNPIRQNLQQCTIDREPAVSSFGLDPQKKTILVIGGSLGARTINQSILTNLALIDQRQVQVVWQTGRYYKEQIDRALAEKPKSNGLYVTEFIKDMAKAYRAADLVISRAGACSISELCMLAKPCILVPSPNVAEDHQTHNAMALVDKGAAVCVSDAEAPMMLLPKAVDLVCDPQQLLQLSRNISQLAMPNAAQVIAAEVIKLAEAYAAQH